MENVFWKFLNFPIIFSKNVMTIELLVSITALIGLVFFVRALRIGQIYIRVTNILWGIIMLRVLMCIIWGFSKTGTGPENIFSVNHVMNQIVNRLYPLPEDGASTVKPAVFMLEALTIPEWVKWVWGIGVFITLIFLIYRKVQVKHKKCKSRVSIFEQEFFQEAGGCCLLSLAFFWFHPLVWLAAICAGKDRQRYCEEQINSKKLWNIKNNFLSITVTVFLLVIMIVFTFTSYLNNKGLTAEQTVRQFYYYLGQNYDTGLRNLFPNGEGDLKLGKRNNSVKNIQGIHDKTEDSKYERYRGHTKKFVEQQVIIVDVARNGYDSKQIDDTIQEIDVFELVRRTKESGWEIVYWSEGDWGYML